MKVYKHRFYHFDYDEKYKCVSFIWNSSTASMTDQEFKDAISNFAGFAFEYKADCLLVDLREFKHTPGADIGEWRTATITPRYNKAGIQKFVYIASLYRPLPNSGKPQKNSGEEFPTCFFTSLQEAKNWISEK